jgi:hypothetical protein
VVLAACGDNKPHTPLALYDRTVTTDEDTAIAVKVSVTAADVTAVVMTVVTPPVHGVLTGTGPSWRYTPAHDFNGTDIMVVRGEDAAGSAMATVTLRITAVDDAPVANPDSFAGELDVALRIPQSAMLANDTDVDSAALTVTAVTAGAHGVPVLEGDTLVFTPEDGFHGAATFVYTVSDGTLTANAVVSVAIGDDHPPVAVDDAVTTAEDTTAVIADAALLGNDSDPDLQTLRISGVANPSHGTVTHTGTQIAFVPDADFHGAAGFDYTVTDGLATAVGSVVVTVTAVNDAPVVVTSQGVVHYTENADPVTIDPGIEVSDADSATLTGATVQITTGCSAGEDVIALAAPPAGITVTGYVAESCMLTLAGAASVASYQAALRAVTYASFSDAPQTADRHVQFTVDDGQAVNHAGGDGRTLAVTAVDDAPVAVNDSATVAEDAGATAVAVLANDTDVDGGAIAIASVTQPTHGSVVITGGGTGLTYAPAANYCNVVSAPGLLGPALRDTFTYTLAPGGGSATVTMTVTCVDDAPVGVDDVATVAEDSADNAIDVLSNDTDVDGGPRTVASITQPAHGTAVIGPLGLSITYTPAADYCNQAPNAARDTFTYTLAPGGSSATVSTTVTCACGKHKPTDFVVGSN